MNLPVALIVAGVLIALLLSFAVGMTLVVIGGVILIFQHVPVH